MLVVSQKAGEKLVLSSGITINILEVKSGKVRLGIDAPKEVEIKRVSQKENTPDKSHK
ncbi:carbon storage regulator [Succinivibrio dextrinosolvens]|jgi:carbon storage regulator|uniref:carbon storage regulator n=1 Tax=Succinivibrio dextrinosolvens TaxID=83771 RepID=UPI0009DFAB1B|nr:carbon storage regulator [Succinivibrio dextrinosolvens]